MEVKKGPGVERTTKKILILRMKTIITLIMVMIMMMMMMMMMKNCLHKHGHY